MFKDLVLKCRSYRRFYQDVALDNKTLRELVDLARNSASAVNRQPLKYLISGSPEKNALIFSTLHWAGTLKTWPGPVEGERPSGYIIILGDKEIGAGFGLDPGIAAQTILLGAVEKGFGGCMLGAVDKDNLRQLFEYSGRIRNCAGRSARQTEGKDHPGNMTPADSFNYWRDKDEGHHVPKRQLKDIIVAEY